MQAAAQHTLHWPHLEIGCPFSSYASSTSPVGDTALSAGMEAAYRTPEAGS